MTNELRPFWQRYFAFNWKFGLFLILLVCIPRFILVLHANATANYRYIGLIMFLSALAPYLFLNSDGRRKIGITKPKKYGWLGYGFIAGLIFSVLLYLLGERFFGKSLENWYIYIGRSYNIPPGIGGKNKEILFAVMAVTGMTFSPIGEELFFRGIVHSSFAASFGEGRASLIDSSAFAVTHISHFGLVFINHKWQFLTIPTIIWVISMFLVSILFFYFKRKSGSLLGAILCHAAFNFGMIYCIFYLMRN
jgi:membrane protease YdiL (CAAX protease family)